MLKPSLRTRTKLALYINQIPLEHKRYDFSQVLRDQSVYHSLWRIKQLASMATMVVGDVDVPEIWNDDYKSPLKDLLRSLSNDAEEGDLGIQCTGGGVQIHFEAPSFQELLERLVMDEFDGAHRGVIRGTQAVIEQLDQALLELIYEIGLEATPKSRFFDHFLRDLMVLVSPRFKWMANHVEAPRVKPEGAVFDQTHATAMSVFLPEWVWSNEGVHQVLPEFKIDARIFDDAVQETWNDQAPISQLTFLIRQALGSKDQNRTVNCFETLVGSLDQFTSLLTAQATVRSEVARAQKPQGVPAEEAPAVKGMEPGAQGELQRALSDLAWLFDEKDPEQAGMLGDPAPEHWTKAEAIVHAALRKAIRRGTKNGTGPIDLNAVIERATIFLIGPAPSKGIFEEQAPVEHQPPMLRRSEAVVVDPAEEQRRQIEAQRAAQRLEDFRQLCLEQADYYGEKQFITSGEVAKFVLAMGEDEFKRANLSELAKSYILNQFGDDSTRTKRALEVLGGEAGGFTQQAVAYVAETTVGGNGKAAVDQLIHDIEQYAVKVTLASTVSGVNLMPIARELAQAAVAKVPVVEEDLDQIPNEEFWTSLPAPVREWFAQNVTRECLGEAIYGSQKYEERSAYFDGLAAQYLAGDFWRDACEHLEGTNDYIDRELAELIENEELAMKLRSLISHRLVKDIFVETLPKVLSDLDDHIWYVIAQDQSALAEVQAYLCRKHLVYGEDSSCVMPVGVAKGISQAGMKKLAKDLVEGRYGKEEDRIEKAYGLFAIEVQRRGLGINAELERLSSENDPISVNDLGNEFMKRVVYEYGPGGSRCFSTTQNIDADKANLLEVMTDALSVLKRR